jgi:hypothetical protein
MQPGKAKGTFKEGFLCGNPAAAPFKDLDDFYNRGQLVHLEEFFVYEHEWLTTEILIPVKQADFSRASIEDAVNAVIQTPDPDFVGKLILADHVHPMAPCLEVRFWSPWLPSPISGRQPNMRSFSIGQN